MALGGSTMDGIMVEITFPGRHSSSATKLLKQVTSCMNIKCVGKVSTIHHPLLYLRKLTEEKKHENITCGKLFARSPRSTDTREFIQGKKNLMNAMNVERSFSIIRHLIVVFKIKTMRSWRDGENGKLFVTQTEDMNSVG